MSTRLDIGSYRHIVVLTGAGISVASGLRPYRGPGGLWEEEGATRNAERATMESAPQQVWTFHAEARRAIAAAAPNAAHRALAQLERSLDEGRSLTVITQNVDGLHQAAGSREVIELHGSLRADRCRAGGCDYRADARMADAPDECPRCPSCDDFLRPDVVLFGEEIPGGPEWHAKRALRECDLFLAVGTSGTVAPASGFARAAKYVGARTLHVNVEPMAQRNPYFDDEIIGRAESTLPALIGGDGKGVGQEG